MSNRRISKYSRRTNMSSQRRKRSPIIIVIPVFVLLCLIVSVAVGNMLGRRADNIKSGYLFDFERVEYYSNGKTVRSVEAYRLPRGDNAGDYVYQGIRDLSVRLRDGGGALQYFFSTGEKFKIDDMEEGYSFSAVTESAHQKGGYVCAYIYITSFDVEDSYLREVYKSYELALISEAAELGADDILLLGIEISDQNISEVEEFAARAALAAEKAVLGIAVSEETLKIAENGVYHAGRIMSSCDYLALDLSFLTDDDTLSYTDGDEYVPSRLENIIEDNEYYINLYRLRLLFSENEREVHRKASSIGVVNFQVIGE